MAELVWEGKYLNGVRVRPAADAWPIATDEVFGDGADAAAPPNRLILGDRGHALPALLPEWAGRFALVYIDPPFDTGDRLRLPGDGPRRSRGDAARRRCRPTDDARGLDAMARVVFRHGVPAPRSARGRRQPLRAPRRACRALREGRPRRGLRRGRVPARDRLAHRLGQRLQVARARMDPQPRHAPLLRQGRPPGDLPQGVRSVSAGLRAPRRQAAARPRAIPIEDVWNASDDRPDGQHPDHVFLGREGRLPHAEERGARGADRSARRATPGDLVLDCFVGIGDDRRRRREARAPLGRVRRGADRDPHDAQAPPGASAVAAVRRPARGASRGARAAHGP